MDALRLVGAHLAMVLGPLVVAAAVLHQLNVVTTRVLGETFGPRAVVWFTGWLGTPVHELSHAAACVVFRHRIEELVLFRPDPATGVVGYVRYRWSPRNPWALLGHGLVGVAPLFGGAAVLVALLVALGPAGAMDRFGGAIHAHPGAFGALVAGWVERVRSEAAILVDPRLLSQPKTWLFAYLALCVGTHLAPSGVDLKGAWPSLALAVTLIGLADLTLVWWLGDAGTAWAMQAAAATIPVAAVLALAAVLVAGGLAAVLAAATVWSTVTGRGPSAPLRSALRQPWRLTAVGAAVAAAGWLTGG
ncbi:MAG: hypothetical protein ABMB14_24725 [Myxococcota bacterium]